MLKHEHSSQWSVRPTPHPSATLVACPKSFQSCPYMSSFWYEPRTWGGAPRTRNTITLEVIMTIHHQGQPPKPLNHGNPHPTNYGQPPSQQENNKVPNQLNALSFPISSDFMLTLLQITPLAPHCWSKACSSASAK